MILRTPIEFGKKLVAVLDPLLLNSCRTNHISLFKKTKKTEKLSQAHYRKFNEEKVLAPYYLYINIWKK